MSYTTPDFGIVVPSPATRLNRLGVELQQMGISIEEVLKSFDYNGADPNLVLSRVNGLENGLSSLENGLSSLEASLPKIATGRSTSISVQAATALNIPVSFPAGLFTAAPVVLVMADAPVAWNPFPLARATSRSQTGFSLQVYCTAARSGIAVDWIAIQV